MEKRDVAYNYFFSLSQKLTRKILDAYSLTKRGDKKVIAARLTLNLCSLKENGNGYCFTMKLKELGVQPSLEAYSMPDSADKCLTIDQLLQCLRKKERLDIASAIDATVLKFASCADDVPPFSVLRARCHNGRT